MLEPRSTGDVVPPMDDGPPPYSAYGKGHEEGYLLALRDVRESVLKLVKEEKAFELTEFLNLLRARIEQMEGTNVNEE